jgi:Transposase DDE domain group 1
LYPRVGFIRLQLFALAYDLANFLRTLALPDAVAQWSLTTLREKLVKVGARLVRHGRYVTFQLAEVAVPRALFAESLCRIDRLRGPPVAAWPERTTERPAPRGEPCARGR